MMTIRGLAVVACGLVVALGSAAEARQAQAPAQEVTTAPQEREARPLTEVRRASELTDADLIGPGNEKIGDVNDWVMDQQGRPLYVVVGSGGVLGIGQDHVAIPFRAVRIAHDRDRGWNVSVGMTEEQLENAPKIGDDYRQLINPEWYRTNATYFGLDEDQLAADQVPTTMIRLDELVGTDVESPAREKIADIDDVILDHEFRPVYAILGAGGFLGIGQDKIPVPYEKLTIGYDETRQRSHIAIDMTQEQLERAPRIEDDDYRVLLNPEVQQRISSYYNETTRPN